GLDAEPAVAEATAGACAGSTFAELEALPGLLAAELLALHRAGVARHEVFSLQLRLVLGVELHQGAGDAQAHGFHLAGDATAANAGDDIELALGAGEVEGLMDLELLGGQ